MRSKDHIPVLTLPRVTGSGTDLAPILKGNPMYQVSLIEDVCISLL